MRCSIGFGCAWVLAASAVAGCASDGSNEPAQYAWCSIDDPGRNHHAVSFPEPLTGTFVGDIYRTTDGGYTWTPQGSSENQRYNDVVFTDVNTGTIVGPEGIILRTTDGGATWVAQDGGTDAVLDGVSFADADNGMVVGDEGTILHTSDGGATWTAQQSGTDVLLRGVWMSDSSIATAVGDSGTILRTTDGGAIWMAQESGTELDLHAVSFASSTTGIAVGSGGTMLRTSDGGDTWVVQDVGTRVALYDVWFADENVGTAVGADATILRTTDAGATWAPEATDGYYWHWEMGMEESIQLGATFRGVSMPDADNGFAVGEPFYVMRRMSVQDNFGVCDAWCDKNAGCYSDDVVGCDVECRCNLRYHNLISPECERAVVESMRCFTALTCEQIEAYFDDPENHPCTPYEEQIDAACD